MPPLLSLRAEIAACLIAVSLLGLVAGWMLQRLRASRRLGRVSERWESRYAELERNARQDEANLEERLQSLGAEVRTLTAENRALREASRGEDVSSDSVRAEAIEMNRRQAETQERLQRIIREREREIATLRASLEAGGSSLAAPFVASTGVSAAVRNALGPSAEQGTPGDIVTAAEALDETVRIDPAQLPNAPRLDAANESLPAVAPSGEGVVDDDGTGEGTFDGALENTFESTIEVAMLDSEEATVALDDETLALVRGLGGAGKG